MKLELNDDSLPKGAELHVIGLGTLINGKAVDFDKEAIEAFEAQVGQKITSAFKSNANVTVSGVTSSPEKEGGE